MKNITKYAIGAVALSFAMVSFADIKTSRNYINIKSVDQFNNQIKQKKHTVVLFFDRSDKGGERAYNKAKKAYDAAADVELYKDQKDLQFLKVNTAYGNNHRIFDEYKVMSDGETIATKPVIFLFRDGKMIDNQLSGNITEKRVRRFVENYFKDLRTKEEKPATKKPAKAKMMQQEKSSMY